MAEVWAAMLGASHQYSKLAAVKTTLPEYAKSTEYERMFLDEAHVASAIHHPNVCGIFPQLGKDRDILFIAMELVFGASLFAVLRAEGTPKALYVPNLDPNHRRRVCRSSRDSFGRGSRWAFARRHPS